MAVDINKIGYQQPSFRGEESQKSGSNPFLPALGVGALAGGGAYYGLPSPPTQDAFVKSVQDGTPIAYTKPLTKEQQELIDKAKKAGASTATTEVAEKATKGKVKAPSEKQVEKQLDELFGKVKEGKDAPELAYKRYLHENHKVSTLSDLEAKIKEAKKDVDAQKKAKAKLTPNFATQVSQSEQNLAKAQKMETKFQEYIDAKKEATKARAGIDKDLADGIKVSNKEEQRVAELEKKVGKLDEKLSKATEKLGITKKQFDDYLESKKAKITSKVTSAESEINKAVKKAEDAVYNKALKAAKKTGGTVDEAAVKAASKAEATAAGEAVRTAKIAEIAEEQAAKYSKKFYTKHAETLQETHDKIVKELAKKEGAIARMEADLGLAKAAKESGTKITRASAKEVLMKEAKTVTEAVGSKATGLFEQAFKAVEGQLEKVKNPGKAGLIGLGVALAAYLGLKLAGGSDKGEA